MTANAGTISVRCEGITGAGKQCKCWGTQKVNDVPLCKQHAAKELRGQR